MKKIYSLLFFALMGLSIFAQNTIDNSFFDQVKFRGAFGSEDWASGWSNYDPQNTSYPDATVTIAAGTLSASTTWGESVVANKASFTNSKLQDSFFDEVDYIGAFGDTDWTEGWANYDPQNTVYGDATVTVEAGSLTADATWTSGNVYLLNGFVYVPSGITLTIEAGTVVRGDKTNKGTIIVEMGGQLIAKGTKLKPIVFTSNQAVGSRAAGDWGGIILLGKSTCNASGGTATIEGGVGRTYGGGTSPDESDNSGDLEYVRIEYPGIAFEPNNEINGLTCGGVGNGTTLNYIQVSFSGDDSYEWFGGTVNAKHLIAYQGLDDDFDTDNGYSGMIQYAVALRNPDVADEAGDSNGFESDNDASGTTNTPYTSAVFSNFSMYGPRATASTTVSEYHARGIYIRRNSRLNIFNSVIAGYVKGIQIKDATTQAAATENSLNIENCLLVGCSTFFNSSFERNYFMSSSRNNDTLVNNSDLYAIDPFNLSGPDFLYNPGNTYLLNGFVYVPDGVTLTIKPGTIIRGDKTNKGTIIVEMGGKLMAEGTADNPIVFTSNQVAGSRAAGDWGGIILLGKSTCNASGGTATIEGGVGRTYGGGTSPDESDNSGTLEYVRIEFPGIAFEPNNEINGLTCGGVGNGTTLNYIQVSYSGDDSYEWFGGTVNAKHLIAYKGLDDDFDTDNGYSGMVQYAVALRDPQVADEAGDSNGFESDNDASGTTNEPFTQAVFSNVSFFGPQQTSTTDVSEYHARGIYIRRNSRLNIYNTIIAGPVKGIQIKDTRTQNAATNDSLKIQNTVIAGAGSKYFDSSFEREYFMAKKRSNDTLTSVAALSISDPYGDTPDFLPATGSSMLEGSYWDTPEVTYTISMTISNGTAVISGAAVTIGTETVTTGATGIASFSEMANGTYTYLVVADGYKVKTGSLTVADADVNETITLTANDPDLYSITFVVTDSVASTPIENAQVTINNVTQSTDASGIIIFEDLTVGIYSYQITKDNFKQVSTTVEIVDENVLLTVKLQSTVSVNEQVAAQVNIYPNPVSDVLYIESDAEVVSAIIYNVMGQAVKSEEISDNAVNVGELENGLYFIQVYNSNNKVVTKRFIKK